MCALVRLAVQYVAVLYSVIKSWLCRRCPSRRRCPLRRCCPSRWSLVAPPSTASLSPALHHSVCCCGIHAVFVALRVLPAEHALPMSVLQVIRLTGVFSDGRSRLHRACPIVWFYNSVSYLWHSQARGYFAHSVNEACVFSRKPDFDERFTLLGAYVRDGHDIQDKISKNDIGES